MISIILHNLFGVDAMQFVLSFIRAATIGAFFCRSEDTHMYVCVIERRYFDLSEEVDAVRRVCNADQFEVSRGEGHKIGIGDVFYSAEVFWFMLWVC